MDEFRCFRGVIPITSRSPLFLCGRNQCTKAIKQAMYNGLWMWTGSFYVKTEMRTQEPSPSSHPGVTPLQRVETADGDIDEGVATSFPVVET